MLESERQKLVKMEERLQKRIIGQKEALAAVANAVRRRPYSVVLFDEIEKGHHDVFNVLLQVLDDGRLTDGQGRTVDFRNTIVIMTSNIGSPIIQEFYDAKKPSAQDHEEMERLVKTELKAHFRPEFLNRVDDIIIFHNLDEDQLGQIVDIQLERLDRRLAQQQLSLEVDRAARKLLAREGFDPQFGARPLKRTIQERLLDPLATRLLLGEFKAGDRIKVSVRDSELVLEKK
jgi:ATP-dependent Clp protease ATP-binding subunit ClpB